MTITKPIPYRPDCEERYTSMHRFINHQGASLIDIGCANGYFMYRFLEDGGAKAVGVEPNEKYKNELIVRSIDDVKGNFDYCFYLDLHYHDNINYFPWIKDHVKYLFVAPSGMGRNKQLTDDLMSEFGNCKYVSTSPYANRDIYYVVVNEVN